MRRNSFVTDGWLRNSGKAAGGAVFPSHWAGNIGSMLLIPVNMIVISK